MPMTDSVFPSSPLTLGRRWWATKGGGTWADGRQSAVSGIDNINDAQVNDTERWLARLGHAEALMISAARRSRGLAISGSTVSSPKVRWMSQSAVEVQPYDLAAVRLLVEEAGGSFVTSANRAMPAQD